MISFQLSRRCVTLGLFAGLAALSVCQSIDPNMYSALSWRNIGPFRGGRIAAVSGAIGQPGTYYAGMPMGGVWKTTSAGVTWYPIFDSVKSSSSVGAVEVAPSDPNVIYVGMGDMVAGGGICEGDGIYKSTDAGATWTHMGLEFSKQIPSILVDPRNPDIVMACVQGNRFAKTEDRGVYRSTDGGKTWTKTLYVDDQTGAQKIAWAFDNPSVMLATTVRHYSTPGGGGRGGGGGFGGGAGAPGVVSSTKLFKSTDEGVTWKEVTGGGLPDLSGRTCVAVANGTNSQRMFLVQNSGLYRSNDGGATWAQTATDDQRVRNGQGGYNCGVYVNQKDPDTVYVINTCSYISHDGGKTFTGFKGAPGGDDPQQMWLDPTDANRLFLGMDQGATISLDGGKNWSLWYNQINAQMYHMSVDNQFPYWVYGTEQDSGSVSTASRGNYGEITMMDWAPHPGYEFGSIVADPLNPKITYAGGPSRGIVKVTNPSGQWIDVSPTVDSKMRLRQVGNQPLAFSPTNPHELMAGFQYLMSTTDAGMHWKKLSPDLGYPKGATPPADDAAGGGRRGGGSVKDADEDQDLKGQIADPNYVPEGDEDEVEIMQGGGGGGGSIESFSASSVAPGTIWVGTNNGLVKMTKDHGKTWDDVTIPNLDNPTRADVSGIDASHQDPGTAYAAIDYHNTGDFKPYLYRTHDYGKTWTKIVNGLPADMVSGSFTRVIRADTKKAGLLFAGTESSVYVSFNDGDTWQPLTQNLPNTSYRDLAIKDNDLIACTYGRGFWVLDDFSPLREMTAAIAAEPAHLFKPGDAYRVRRNVNGDTPFPPEVPHAANPPEGAIIYYYLGSAPSRDVSVDVYDSAGKPVRHFSSAAMTPWNEPAPPVPDFWVSNPKPIPAMQGMNRINWDVRYDAPPAFDHSYEINANPNGTPPSPEGPLATPGVYTVKLTVDGKTYSQNVTIKNDPRSPASDSDIKSQHTMQMDCYEGSIDAMAGFQQVAAMRATVADIQKGTPPSEVADAAKAFDDKLAAVGGSGGGRRGFGRGGGGAAAPTFSGVNRTMVGHIMSLDSGDMAPNQPERSACDSALTDLNTVEWNWLQLNGKDLSDFNAILVKNNLKVIPAANGIGHPKAPVIPKPPKAKKEDKKPDAKTAG
jgi:photosystem II stability/assembly factor-like uncharacterized protein